MTFESIAAATKLPVNEVEHLCMKAMRWVIFIYRMTLQEKELIDSLDLIRGSLDQVDSTLDVKWVQPRVLDHDQLATLSKQFNEWSGSVGQTAEAVHAHRVDSDQKPAEVKAM
jgi:26S proteasome regulatory subunit N9